MEKVDEINLEKFSFLQENAMVVSNSYGSIYLTEGSRGNVDFPVELLTELHKRNPGYVYELAHTHPPGFWKLSPRDRLTLKSWAFAFSPFPIRMSVLTWMPEGKCFNKYTGFAALESKEEWIKRGKVGTRKFEVLEEENFLFDPEEYFDAVTQPPWIKLLLNQSYSPT